MRWLRGQKHIAIFLISILASYPLTEARKQFSDGILIINNRSVAMLRTDGALYVRG